MKCSVKRCPNTFNKTVGGGGLKSGPDCMPCYYAKLMLRVGRKPEEIESHPMLVEMNAHFERGGWTWDDLKDSYARLAGAS